ncbi:MAG: hypothetical protein QOI26_146, partial [Pseudonocardiales bacterium]|nr:hypothetical protein [Pseudonocardiales bacterium]
MKFGLLLPHFGEQADGQRILAGSARAQELGFSSVWARDHLLFEPIGDIDGADSSFLEALTVLTAVGQQCQQLTLGTAALVPYRNPIHSARILATMANIVGPRLAIGVGGGSSDREFAAIGMGGIPRAALMQSQVGIMKALLSEPSVTWKDEFYDFDDVSLEPRPTADAVRFWWCGSTPKAARLAASVCDGWLPGRITMRTMQVRLETLDEAAAAVGRPRPPVGIMPTTSIHTSRERALATIDVPGLCRAANRSKFFVKPDSGEFRTPEDLTGMLLAGSPDEVAEQCAQLAASGVETIVFDCRAGF